MIPSAHLCARRCIVSESDEKKVVVLGETSDGKSPCGETPPAQNRALVVAPRERAEVASLFFASQGWDVHVVPDNSAALAAAKTKAFHVVITDESTGAKEDVELLRKIRAVHPHTRIIILTDEGTSDDVVTAVREHAFSYFRGPYSLHSLEEIIRLAMKAPCIDDGIEVVSATPSWVRLLVRADKDTAERMVQFFREMVDMPEDERESVAFAFREMLLNALRYGAKFDPTQFIEISYVRAQRVVGCRVKDPGEGFKLDELQHAALANPEDDPLRHMAVREQAGLPQGGYGILLAQHSVDELLYSEKGNEVLLVKYLKSEAAA